MKRPGQTKTISISVDAGTLAALRVLARRTHDGNVSATIAELAITARKLEAQHALIEKYRLPPLSDEARSRIDAEWAPAPTPKRRRPRAA